VSEGVRVAILGGGMAGLAAAWELSKPANRGRIGSITVYQRGWRLGGKGSSGRGVHGRVEEHGLHVWLGYYDNAFRMMRECYAELDRPRTDPGSPLLRWDDAFRPASRVGLGEHHDGEWLHWIADFSQDSDLPGEPGSPPAWFTVVEFVRRSLVLLRDLGASLAAERQQASTSPDVVVTTSPTPPRPARERTLAGLLRDGELGALVVTLELASLAQTEMPALQRLHAPLGGFVRSFLDPIVDRLRKNVGSRVGEDTAARRVWHFLDLMRATLRGIVADDLLRRPEGFAAIDDYDYREWVARHGATAETLVSPLVKGVYDLAFAYEEGDDASPRFAAGTGVLLSAKLFFDYRGAIFWKMMAGMGDVVFAPLYEVLERRGVQFRFFHRVDNLRVSADGTSIGAIDLGVQVKLRPGIERYEPLIDVAGLKCWPSLPRHELLDTAGETLPQDFETVWSTVPEPEAVAIRAGRDFDVAVLAVPVGMHPYICNELIENPRTPEWRTMTDHLQTVATQAMQLWLRVDEAALGWAHPDVTVTGYADRFHTHASMSHLLPAERWPDRDRPEAIVYFCHTLPAQQPPPLDLDHPQHELARVRANALEFLRSDIARRWPASTRNGEFRWEILCGGDDATGEGRLDCQYLRANVDPSDRYVLSLPGTGRYRLRVDESGYANLVLAGDWVDSGLNAGCIEAAVMSGIQAANAVLGRPLLSGVTGFYLTHRGRAGRPWEEPSDTTAEPATPPCRS
jgi:uncharacterized protein with NAD-binding domain and iron-sulfur cluster